MLRRNPVQLDCPPGDSRSNSSRSPEPSLAEQQNILFDFEHAVPKDGPPPGCDKGDSQSRRIHPGFPTDKAESSNSRAEPKDVLSRTSKATFDSAGAGSPIFRMSLPESDVASEAVVAQEENQDQNLDRVKDGLRNILLRSSRPTANR
ncbi:hypothetical protein V8E54_011836 [Elaphomyces granulatus]